ncbi:DUF397 domain-containing protein [Actinophytocola gossypii]|uniref:DUF397 domain-containing protein n=1 Tax=Actinophytocola gossypii TaxID=2812003 RepID=A0ABT2JHC7_9PSEU|nr:DUF397 domain-containing protein [Actinophytocola gossypii]MCT2587288.1 DUF397 domain-containing protein [Actinophytocola gossypii]
MLLSTWRKSSHSEAPDGDCVEVAWRKSSYSSSPDGNCVEVAFVPVGVAVRDSKNTSGPTLAFENAAWRGFLATAGR